MKQKVISDFGPDWEKSVNNITTKLDRLKNDLKKQNDKAERDKINEKIEKESKNLENAKKPRETIKNLKTDESYNKFVAKYNENKKNILQNKPRFSKSGYENFDEFRNYLENLSTF